MATEAGLTAPRERLRTMPEGLPEFTLGYEVLVWIESNLLQPNGPDAGRPFKPTIGQAIFILWFYAVDKDGRWLYNRSVRRLAKGSGKSPFAAVLALAELLGPVRVAQFNPDVPGGVEGMPVSMPLVQIAATSEKQTQNTMRMVRAMANKRTSLAKTYHLDSGKTYIETPNGGKLEQITSSEGSAEGAESSFVVGDETEHWTPGMGGPGLMDTLVQNATKSAARVLETSNAWVPGADSVAEDTFNAWVDQEEGRTRATQTILYDAVVAPPNTVLHDDPEDGEVGLSDALREIYSDCDWVTEERIDAIRNQVWATNYPESRSRRFFLNQPNAAEDAWVTLQEWSALADPGIKVDPGEEIVMFFDGSKSNDHTALIGCRMSDGHVFTLGVWAPEESTGTVNFGKVDGAIDSAFALYDVVAFYADVREWESYVRTAWPEKYGDQLLVWAVPKGKEPAPIAWDMRSHAYIFAEAAEMCYSEIQEKDFTHDGNWEVSRHVGNARVNEVRGRFTIKKESPKSANKIDAAVCVVGARMVYRAVKASPEWEKRKNKGNWAVYV